MALDVGNFTLSFKRRPSDPAILDLFHLPPPVPYAYASEGSSRSSSNPLPYYTYQRARVPTYRAVLLDPITEAPLAEGQTAASSLLSRSKPSPSPSSSLTPSGPTIRPTDKELQRLAKSRSLRLFNPDASVELEKKRNTFSQEWVWKWEGETFVWHKDSGVGPTKATYSLEVSRKPEPDIAAAIYKPNARPFASSPGVDVGIGPLSTSESHDFLQIFSYNLQRLDVSDRRGLEVALITTLLALLDLEYDEKQSRASNIYGAQREWLEDDVGSLAPTGSSPAIPLRSDSSQSLGGSSAAPARQLERNEVLVDLYGSESTFVSHALMLLRQDEGGDKCPFILLRAEGRETIQKAVRVAAEVKRGWYRLPVSAKGPPLDETDTSGELHQYVQSQEVGGDITSSSSQGGGAAVDPSRPAVRDRIKLNNPPNPSNGSPSASSQGATPAGAPYLPPQSLTIWLSKMRLPELESKAKPTTTTTPGIAFAGYTSLASDPKRSSHGRIPSGGSGSGFAASFGLGEKGSHPYASGSTPSGSNGTGFQPPSIPPKVPFSAFGSGSSGGGGGGGSGGSGGGGPAANQGSPSNGSSPSTTSKLGRGGVSKLLGKLAGGGGGDKNKESAAVGKRRASEH